MTNDSEYPSTVASVDRTTDILSALKDARGGRLTQLAETLELPKSSVHRHLKTLERSGFVVRKGDEYHLGLRFLHYGGVARKRWDSQGIIRESVRYLAVETKERAQFMVWEHGAMVYLYRELGERAVQTDTIVGKRMPIHATSGGKAILAYLSEREREEFLDGYTLNQYTDRTITDRDTLSNELRKIRREGLAVNRQEYIDGLQAVSVPVQVDGTVIGSIGVSGPTHRLAGDVVEDRLPDLLLGIANEIELKYGHNERFDPPIDRWTDPA